MSGPKWKRETFLHGEAMGRNWGSLSKTKLWNYRKTGTCLHDWWWSPKVVLKSTSKRLSDSMSFSVVPQCFIAQQKAHSWVFWRRLVNHLTLQGLATELPPHLHPQWQLLSSKEWQSLGKPHWVSSSKKLAKHFNDCLFHKYRVSKEVWLVFDRYDFPSSLKTATRAQRQGTTDPVYYHITDSTQIAKVNDE